MNLQNQILKWEFLKNAYNGDGGFGNGEFLVQFPREVDEKYKNRQKMAYYVNYLKPAIERFNGYLFKKTPYRNSSSDLINLIFDDCDNAKNNIDNFMQDFFKNAFLFGTNLILVDMTRQLPKDLKTQKQTRSVPYFIEISPLNLYDYSLKNGAFEWVILKFQKEIKEPFGKSEIITEYHYYDATKFQKRDGKFEIIEQIEHNLGICPVISLNISDNILSDTISYEIAEISRRIYNARSELDEILRGQTFSILTYNVPNGAEPPQGLKISTDNVLLYNGNKPEFVSPASANAEIYGAQIKELENIITEISLNPVNLSTKASDTGVALQFKFENLNGYLMALAKKMEDFERKVFEICFKWLNLEYDFNVSYANDFQISDLKSEIENAAALKEFGLPLTWQIAKMKQLARLDLIGADEEQMAEIYNEIDDCALMYKNNDEN